MIVDIVHTYSSKIILIFLGLISNVIITRSLGVADYGNYIFVMTIITMGMQFGSFGLQSSNIYYVSKSKRLLGMLLKNSLIFSILSGVIVIFVISILYYLRPEWFRISKKLFIFAMLMIPLSLISLYSKNLLIGIGKIKLDNKITIYMKLLSIFLLVFCLMFSSLNKYSALGIASLVLVVGFFLVYKELNKHIIYINKISLKLFKNISKFGFKAYLSTLLAYLVFKSDLFFVRYYLTNNDLSYYSLSVSFIDYIYILPVVVGTILFQKLSSIKNDNEKYNTMKKLNFIFIIIYGGFLVFTYFFLEYFILILYGKDFINSVAIIRLLLIAIFFMGIETIQVQYLNTIGFPKEIIYYWIFSLLINITVIIIFIKDYGITAVAISTIVAYFSIFLLVNIHIYLKRRNEHKLYNK